MTETQGKETRVADKDNINQSKRDDGKKKKKNKRKSKSDHHSRRKSSHKSKEEDKYKRGVIPPLNNYTLNLISLTNDEEKILNTVLDKDDEVTMQRDAKVSVLRKELRLLRVSWASTEQNNNQGSNWNVCMRCKKRLAIWRRAVPFIDKGIPCQRCKHKVCKNCRQKQNNGLWMCSLCIRYREIKLLTGEWADMGCNKLSGTELLRISLKDKEYYLYQRELFLKKRKARRDSKRRKRQSLGAKSKKKKRGKKDSKKSNKSEKHNSEKKEKNDLTSGHRKSYQGKSDQTNPKHKKDHKNGKHSSHSSKDKTGKRKSSKPEKGKKNKEESKEANEDLNKTADDTKNAHACNINENIPYALQKKGEYNVDEEANNNENDGPEHDDAVDEYVLEHPLILQRKKHRRSRLRASRKRILLPHHQHLRWQDENNVTVIFANNEYDAQGDSDVGVQSSCLNPFEADTSQLADDIKPLTKFADMAFSSGDHQLQKSDRDTTNKTCKGQRIRSHRHRATKSRKRTRHMFRVDYMLNENKDVRDLKNSFLKIQDSKYDGVEMIKFVDSDTTLSRHSPGVEEVIQNRVSFSERPADDTPTSSITSRRTGHSLRLGSEKNSLKYDLEETQKSTVNHSVFSYQEIINYEPTAHVTEDDYKICCHVTFHSVKENQTECCMSVQEDNSSDDKLIFNENEITSLTQKVSENFGGSTNDDLSHHIDSDLPSDECNTTDKTAVLAIDVTNINCPTIKHESKVEDCNAGHTNVQRKKLFTAFRNSKMLKRMKCMYGAIVDNNASASHGFRKFAQRDKTGNFKVQKVGVNQFKGPSQNISEAHKALSKDFLQSQKGRHAGEKGKYPGDITAYYPPDRARQIAQQQQYEERQRADAEQKPRTKSFNLGDVFLKSLSAKKQAEHEEGLIVPTLNQESQTDTRTRLASILCPFCKFSIEFGYP